MGYGCDLTIHVGVAVDLRRWSGKDRYGGPPGIGQSIGVGDLSIEQTVGDRAYLVRSPVVHTQEARAAPNLHTERRPGERFPEDALRDVTGEEQPVRHRAPQCRQEAQLRDTHVLRLVDHHVVPRRVLP
ncbi:MAG: hypothetical protein EA383_00135 [Spirochaetaceae bacterium]|nr:MAG: hypothetical protein EA383_00135 [Spirochaetaceae bacterium]